MKWTKLGIGRYRYETADGVIIKVTQTGNHQWEILVIKDGELISPLLPGTTLAQAKRFVSEYLEAGA